MVSDLLLSQDYCHQLLLAFRPQWWDSLCSIQHLVALALLFKQELIDTPVELNKLKNKYDSISRMIYSGNKKFSVADFHIKLLSADQNGSWQND